MIYTNYEAVVPEDVRSHVEALMKSWRDEGRDDRRIDNLVKSAVLAASVQRTSVRVTQFREHLAWILSGYTDIDSSEHPDSLLARCRLLLDDSPAPVPLPSELPAEVPDETRLEVLSVSIYALGDHLHPWMDASPDLHNRYRDVVRQLYELVAYDAAAAPVSLPVDPDLAPWRDTIRTLVNGMSPSAHEWALPMIRGALGSDADDILGVEVEPRALPVDNVALTIALAQLNRGEEVEPGVAAICVWALARLVGREVGSAPHTENEGLAEFGEQPTGDVRG